MKEIAEMTPSEYVDFMWSQFDQASGGRTDYYRWRDPATLPDRPNPVYPLLSPEDQVGQRQALRDMTKTYRGAEEMWRGIIRRPLQLAMRNDEQQRCRRAPRCSVPDLLWLDARLTFTPRGDRLILIHAPISVFLSELLGPFATAFAGVPAASSDQAVMIENVRRHWKGDHVDNPWQPRTNPQALVHALLLRACQQFVVGHEYGHALLGHREYTDDKATNHAMEYEADAYGARLLFGTLAKGIDSTGVGTSSTECYGLLAPCIVLGGFSLIAPGETLTHPDPLDRMMTFVENYQSYIPLVETHTCARCPPTACATEYGRGSRALSINTHL